MVFVCTEKTANMNKTDKGFYCAVCRKEVQDFTKKSDEEIKQQLKTGGEICGSLRPQQLLDLNFNSFFQRFSLWNIGKRIAIVLFFVLGGMLFSCTENNTGEHDGVLAGAIAIQDTSLIKKDSVNSLMKEGQEEKKEKAVSNKTGTSGLDTYNDNKK